MLVNPVEKKSVEQLIQKQYLPYQLSNKVCVQRKFHIEIHMLSSVWICHGILFCFVKREIRIFLKFWLFFVVPGFNTTDKLKVPSRCTQLLIANVSWLLTNKQRCCANVSWLLTNKQRCWAVFHVSWWFSLDRCYKQTDSQVDGWTLPNLLSPLLCSP